MNYNLFNQVNHNKKIYKYEFIFKFLNETISHENFIVIGYYKIYQQENKSKLIEIVMKNF